MVPGVAPRYGRRTTIYPYTAEKETLAMPSAKTKQNRANNTLTSRREEMSQQKGKQTITIIVYR